MISVDYMCKKSLYELVYNNAFQKKSVRLSSGKTTSYYFDLRQVTCDPRGINEIAKVLYDLIVKLDNIKSVGGLESGSISISTAISKLSYNIDPTTALSSFYVREKAKEHGLGKRIEGIVRSPAVVVDDVVTTGDSALEAIQALKKEDVDVNCLICIVYRGTQEMKEKFEQENGIKIVNLFYEDEFISLGGNV